MWSFTSVVQTIFRLKRTCPKCGRDQVVGADKRKETVKCEFCGADIPPSKNRG